MSHLYFKASLNIKLKHFSSFIYFKNDFIKSKVIASGTRLGSPIPWVPVAKRPMKKVIGSNPAQASWLVSPPPLNPGPRVSERVSPAPTRYAPLSIEPVEDTLSDLDDIPSPEIPNEQSIFIRY